MWVKWARVEGSSIPVREHQLDMPHLSTRFPPRESNSRSAKPQDVFRRGHVTTSGSATSRSLPPLGGASGEELPAGPHEVALEVPIGRTSWGAVLPLGVVRELGDLD
jgi:hypothetical protein